MRGTRKKNVYCILGMHRSGTSMLTKILGICGLSLGDEKDVIESDVISKKGNETGHWENQKFSLINRSILTHFTGGDNWQADFEFPENWVADEGLSKIRSDALALINEFDTKYDSWGWKDPRTCLTLPFWQSMLKNRLVYIIPIRDPNDSANSLYKRDLIPLENGRYIWTIYNEKIVKYTENHNRFFVEIEKIYNNPINQINILLNNLGEKNLFLSATKERAILEFINPDLWHNRDYKKDLLSIENSTSESSFLKLYLFHLFSLTKNSLLGGKLNSELSEENKKLLHQLTEIKKGFARTIKRLEQNEKLLIKKSDNLSKHNKMLLNELLQIKHSHYFKLYPLYERAKSIVKSITTKNAKK